MEHEPPSDEWLLKALNRLRRPGWPTSLEDNMAMPMRAKILSTVARALQVRGDRPAPVEPPKPQVFKPTPAPYVPRPLDRKQLASGEREDD